MPNTLLVFVVQHLDASPDGGISIIEIASTYEVARAIAEEEIPKYVFAHDPPPEWETPNCCRVGMDYSWHKRDAIEIIEHRVVTDHPLVKISLPPTKCPDDVVRCSVEDCFYCKENLHTGEVEDSDE